MFRFINSTLRNPFFDYFLPVFSDKDYVVIPGLVLLCLMLYLGRHAERFCVISLILALFLADIGSENVLKNMVHQQRPYATLDHVTVFRGGQWFECNPAFLSIDGRRTSWGFPSTHATNVAAAAVVFAFLWRRSLWVSAPLCLLVGLSRVYTGNHMPSAVVGGYLWGMAAGLVSALAVSRLYRRFFGDIDVKAPSAAIPDERKRFLWLLGFWTCLNFAFVSISHFDLAGDEAQYWDWSRHLALGYYSKPPLIAYIIRIFVNAGGNKEWAIRSGAVLFSSGTLALLYALTLRVSRREKAAFLAVCAMLAMPASWVGSVLMTIDPPTLFFWALAMYAFHCAVNGSRGMWWVTGLALGLGLLAKYTGALLVVSFALYLLLVDRRSLRTSGPYIALGVMLACMAGVLYWNATHDWVSIRHTASIGAGSKKSVGKAVSHFFEFLGGQAGVVSPILFGFLVWSVAVLARRFRQNRDAAYLFLCSVALFGFYLFVSFTRKPLANWPAAAYVAAIPAFAWMWTERSRSQRQNRLLAAALVLGCLMGAATRCTDLLYFPSVFAKNTTEKVRLGFLKFDPDKEPTNELIGGKEMGAALSKYAGGVDGPFIFANRYQLTAWAAFYTKGHPRTYCMNPGDQRLNQYDLWGGWDKLVGRDGLFVTGGDESKAQQYIDGMVAAGAFERGEFLERIDVYRGKVHIRSFTISRLYNYSGLVMTPPAGKY